MTVILTTAAEVEAWLTAPTNDALGAATAASRRRAQAEISRASYSATAAPSRAGEKCCLRRPPHIGQDLWLDYMIDYFSPH
jgi:hypothetical protein